MEASSASKEETAKLLLHVVAEYGRTVNLLAELPAVCPKSVQDLTIRKEMALHVAVKDNNLEAALLGLA